MPVIAYSIFSRATLVSMRIPPNFFSDTIRSFGHFIVISRPVALLSAVVHPTEAIMVSNVASLGFMSGLSTMLIYTFTPEGDTQGLPSLPLPLTWLSATTTVPSVAPSSASSDASVLVESTVS